MSDSELPDANPSFGERRGHVLTPLQTNFSRPAGPVPKSQASKLQRPRPSEYPSTNGSEEAIPLSPVKHQSSKSSLRSLFGRDKSSRASPENKLAEIDESKQAVTVPDIPNTPLSPSIASPRTARSTPSLSSPTTPRARSTLKSNRPRPENTKPPSQSQYGWKPPALFQAYPQSSKSECLTAPSISADSILRLHATGKNGSEARAQSTQENTKKKESKERKHLRTLSDTINKVEWTQKIYVLATAGFILQYAGDGKHDRLPEKMLQLGPQSVAFASDAIPGKHWVVQVSQNPTADTSTASEPPKSRLGRLGFHRSNARKMAQNFLLVLNDPDSMISWLTEIRDEIEIRGGPKVTTEKFSEDGLGAFQRTKSGPRQMVKKDPHRISSLFLQPQAQNLRIPDDDDDGLSVGGTSMTWQSRRSSFVSDSHRSMLESRAESVSTAWGESNGGPSASEIVKESLSAMTSPIPNPGRNGNASHGTPTATPKTDTFSSRDMHSNYPQSPPINSPPVSWSKRSSLYGASPPPTVPLPARPDGTPGTVPHSNVPESLIRSTSPPATNFSVPSFSKKFVPRQGQPSPASFGPNALRLAELGYELPAPNLSSPPQSPTYSVASSRQTDFSEPSFVARDGTRRILRPSNSEDVLSKTIRSAQHAQHTSRPPRAKTSHETSPPPSRPLSLVGRSGLGIQMGNGGPVQASPAEPVPAPAPMPRSRISTYNDVQKVPHRKSMPGLNLGPPTAPPPNIPLPKIPTPTTPSSPVINPAPGWAKPPAAGGDRFYQSEKVRDHVVDRRKSGMMSKSQTFK